MGIHTWANVQWLAHQSEEQTKCLGLVLLIFLGAAARIVAADTSLPHSHHKVKVLGTVRSDTARDSVPRVKQEADNDVQQSLSQRRTDVRLEILHGVLVANVQAVKELARLTGLLVHEACRLSIVPEESIIPALEVLCFVDEWHQASENAHAVEDLDVDCTLPVGGGELMLKRLQTCDEDVDQRLEVLVRLDLDVWRRIVVGQREVANVLRRPQLEDVLGLLWEGDDLRVRNGRQHIAMALLLPLVMSTTTTLPRTTVHRQRQCAVWQRG